MKKLATTIAAIALIGTPAFAADIAVKAAEPSPAAVYNWTGWYVGVNAGASFGNAKTDFNAAPIFTGPPKVAQITSGFASSNTEYPDGFIGGGQIGYNWQYSPLIVLGVEADFQGAHERDTNNLSQDFFFESPRAVSGGTVFTNYTTKIDWFGTARVRAGYVWGNGDVMSYVTGGLAYGKIDLEGTNIVSGVLVTAGPFTLTSNFSHNAVNAGWVGGYGTEGRLATPGWTWKVEGLWMDLGSIDETVVGVFGGPFRARLNGGQVTTHTRFTD